MCYSLVSHCEICVGTLQVTDATNMAMNALVGNVQVVRECVRKRVGTEYVPAGVNCVSTQQRRVKPWERVHGWARGSGSGSTTKI